MSQLKDQLEDSSAPRHAERPALLLLAPGDWQDYALLDSGTGARLERLGPYCFVRPEPQALWQPALPRALWEKADAIFVSGSSPSEDQEQRGRWQFRRPLEPRWMVRYKDLSFWAAPTPFRHLGVFPEQASHWNWLADLVRAVAPRRPVRVLNLFGYTGLASLAAASVGASVTHVDASKKILEWARANQALSGLSSRPIRWIVDDALKFVQREVRRGSRYDGVIIDPPKFGRGPRGEVWKLQESLPTLLATCRSLLSDEPLFVVLTTYAIRASALSLYYALEEMMRGYGGTITTGEMVLVEESAQRLLSTAIFARWSYDPQRP
ncbi:class I SAM-dependent methyltransferase [Thermogemmatispora onikobensis]|uniref:class I SAM-dependent methyltransferase n=1 Tax=Thermogemmatispora onikobensis TaxID=732234 RepID=UPI000853506D|nr:class I SAM-dependent methyltransferase [Thermogemmatispora onikobensis]